MKISIDISYGTLGVQIRYIYIISNMDTQSLVQNVNSYLTE